MKDVGKDLPSPFAAASFVLLLVLLFSGGWLLYTRVAGNLFAHSTTAGLLRLCWNLSGSAKSYAAVAHTSTKSSSIFGTSEARLHVREIRSAQRVRRKAAKASANEGACFPGYQMQNVARARTGIAGRPDRRLVRLRVTGG